MGKAGYICPAIVLSALLVMSAIGAPAQSAPHTIIPNEGATRVQQHLQQASDAMHAGDLTLAEKELRSALALDPNSLAALNNLGIVLAREGKPTDAIPLYERALRVRPGDSATKRNLAIAYFKAHRYGPAWSLVQPLTAASPTDFQLLDLAGFTLFALDRDREAAQYLERANEADPSDLETLDMLGKAYLRMKDYKALPSVFERIMKVNPNSAAAHVMMGTAYDQRSDRTNAIKEYQAAEQSDPSFMGVHSGLGYLYWRQGNPDLAETEMRAELQRFPEDPVANCILGQILLNNSQLGDARSHFQAALTANPRYFDALLGLGKTEIALGHPDAAIPSLRKAVAISPKQVEGHFVLGTALRQSGHRQEGIHEQKLSVELQNQSTENTGPK